MASIIALLTGHLLSILNAFDGLTTEVGAVWNELAASQPELASRAQPFVDQVAALYRERGMNPITAKALALETWEKLSEGKSPINPNHYGLA
jgi:hypothetical protein